ncbi:rho GTPase-activating protein 12-like isoform X2 [Pectinophora gossypiella]|nr:rho GTPase-activating protein 12-like isoform X2 [Pectinophora gossypiella]
MSCEVASWIPAAVASTLRGERASQPVLAWLTNIRATTEEYDPLVVVRPPSPQHSDSPASEDSEHTEPSTSPDSAFDEILSQLGKEIFKLDEYQRNLVPSERDSVVSLSILNIFDKCLEGMQDTETNEQDKLLLDEEVKLVNGVTAADSDAESSLSDVSFVTSTPAKSDKVADVNGVIDNAARAPPVPPRRTRLKTPSSPSSVYDNMEVKTENTVVEVAKRLDSDSDSESTCWSYKECSTDGEGDGKDSYAAVWSHSSGFHNSDEILRRVLSQHYATISRISFDTTSDFSPTQYSVYSLQEVGDRCACAGGPVAAMTPDKPTDDGYEPVRDAITDENIYEEIEYGCSYTDEGCSCGGSVEVESISISASSEGVGRDSPLYANLRDHDAYAVPADVIFWKNLLLDPYYNDDEEDEWITPEECAVYSREQRPPLVIPRITQYRPPRRDIRATPTNSYTEESPIPESASIKSSVRQYEQLQDWSPTSERSRMELERGFSKASSDSPPFVRLNKRFGGSTENLLHANRRPNHLQLPASSSGDSLDVEVRDREPGYARSRKSRSMVAPKHRMRSPVPAPRMMMPHAAEATVLLEGPVKRTKFSESGKKSRKNWLDCYMILTPTALVFYKDQKTYYATKMPRPPGTPPSPTAPRAELVLPLRNAHIMQCIQMHTRRYTRSLVLTVGYDQYLLQDETEEGAKRWLKCIQNVYYKLGPPKVDEYPPQYQSSNTDLESLGRTPPVSRHANRNQQKEEPVFGRKLEEVCPAASPRVPEFVVACVREIESNEENMCTDGLYRASGNLSQVQKIRLEVDQNNLSVIENSTDIHVLTGSLKLFFRELKEPLIPCSMFDRVLAACSIKPRESKIKEFRDIVHSLPQCNRETLKFLLEHLLRVTQFSERNRMHTANLAIVFGPTLLWAPAEQAHNIAIDCIQQNHVVEILLNEFKDIFEDNKAKKKT